MERSAVVSTPSAVGAAGEAHSHSHAQQHHHHHHHQQHHLPDDALDKYDDMASDLSHSASRKRDLDDYDDDDDEDDDDGDDGADYSHNTINNSNSLKDASESKRLRSASASPASTKRLRRHTWQKKYAAEFGLVVIEKDHASGAVMLAMCGFCKAFGRENKIEHVLQSDDGDGDGKKRRRRSLTTIKFFRTFRIDNIRSHLQGAHPRRWAAFEALPKLDAVRARYLQVQGEATYDGIHMVDDVMLNSTTLQTESDVAYAQAQLHALAPHATSQALESPLPAAAIPHHTSASSPTAGATGASAGAAVTSSASSAPTAAVSTHANVVRPVRTYCESSGEPSALTASLLYSITCTCVVDPAAGIPWYVLRT